MELNLTMKMLEYQLDKEDSFSLNNLGVGKAMMKDQDLDYALKILKILTLI